MPMWRNGRRGRLKIYSRQLGAGSNPVIGTSLDTFPKGKCPLSFYKSLAALQIAFSLSTQSSEIQNLNVILFFT